VENVGQLRVGVIFGGPSAEHQVSAASALSVVRGLSDRRFRPVVIGVGRDSRWRLLAPSAVEEAAARRADGPAIADGLIAGCTEVELRPGGRLVGVAAPETVVEQFDVAFPVMHGPYGEDGVVQGYLEACGVPYVGCGVLASAVSMDKVAMRRAFAAEGIPCVPCVWFTEGQWRASGDPQSLAGGLALAAVRQARQHGLLHRHLTGHQAGRVPARGRGGVHVPVGKPRP